MAWSKEKLNRYIKEGRGQGEGKDYLPWTLTHEFSSLGRSSRVLGLKSGRVHHLHSDNQLRAFLIFEWNDRVEDIRECYPLLDVMEVIDDKESLRFDKFVDKESGEQLVITTNFILTIKDSNGNIKYVARTVKNTSELTKKITWEKLEIERRYWWAKGIEWKVITEKQLDRQYAKNIEWVRETLLPNQVLQVDIDRASEILHSYLLNNEDKVLKDLLKQFDDREEFEKGSSIYILRYLIAKKLININMKKKVDTGLKVKELIL